MPNYAIMPYEDYQNICDSLREKTGTSERIVSGDIPDMIDGISTGGGSDTPTGDVCAYTISGTGNTPVAIPNGCEINTEYTASGALVSYVSGAVGGQTILLPHINTQTHTVLYFDDEDNEIYGDQYEFSSGKSSATFWNTGEGIYPHSVVVGGQSVTSYIPALSWSVTVYDGRTTE